MEEYSLHPQVFNDMCELNRAFHQGINEIERYYRKKRRIVILKGVAAAIVGMVLLMVLYVYLTN